MSRNTQRTKKHSRETDDVALRPSLLRIVDQRVGARGEIELPCIPALLDHYATLLGQLWDVLGKPFTRAGHDQLRGHLERGLAAGYRASPHALLVIQYRSQSRPRPGFTYDIRLKIETMSDHYTRWLEERTPPLFGALPDAKLTALAAELGDPARVAFLDVGAGTGRNTLALARLGHPTTAVEVVPGMADQIRAVSAAENLAVRVVEGNILSSSPLGLEKAHYNLVVMTEVITHFRDAEDVRLAFRHFAEAVAPGGLVLVSAFLAMSGYKPDQVVRETSHTAWSTIFTRADLEFLTTELPFDKVSDESVYEFERDHLPAEGWPPTGWFEDWSQGGDVFDLSADKTPISLRWLVYRRR